jgi:hypothetical protein
MSAFCEPRNEPSRFIETWANLDQQNNSWLLKIIIRVLVAGVWLGSLFDPEDGRYMFSLNVCVHLSNY